MEWRAQAGWQAAGAVVGVSMHALTEQVAARTRQLAAEIRASRGAHALREGSGRGIVVVAGGERIFTNAYVLLHMLRHALHCSLPVELWCFGASEVSPAMAALLEPLGTRLVDATPMIAAADASIRDGWQLKAFALAHSGFAEVLLLDADQVPVVDPAICFDWPQYQQAGTLFWPDAIDLRRDNAIWSLLGLPPRRQVSLDSGQLLVDRRRHRPALAAALRLNEAADDIYQIVYGDKDTFLLAWEMIGADHVLLPHRPYRDEWMFVQRDFEGAPVFQHRTNSKWEYGGKPRSIPGFVHEAACRVALAELEERWSGNLFIPPERSASALRLEKQLLAGGPFVLEAGEAPAIPLELRPYAEIGIGRAGDRRHWWVEADDAGARLILSGGEHRSYVLELGPDHLWTGYRYRAPVVPSCLMAAARGEAIRPAEATPPSTSPWRIQRALDLVSAYVPAELEE
jgi:hypothetical protein